MERGLLFFTLSLGAIYLVIDDFYGHKYVSQLAQKLTPNLSLPLEKQITGAINAAKKHVKSGVEASKPANQWKSGSKTPPAVGNTHSGTLGNQWGGGFY